MPGRTSTTKPRIWSTDEQTVMRLPTYLLARVKSIALHLDKGGDVQVIPIPDLFTVAKKPAKSRRKYPVTGTVPHGTKPKKGQPVTGTVPAKGRKRDA